MTGIHPDYPSSRFLAAGGEGDSPERARDAAMTALRKRFDGLVQEAHRRARTARSDTGWYHPLAVAPTPVPTSLEVGVSWRGELSDRTAVLAVLDKRAEAAVHLDQMKAACDQAQEFTAAADQALEQDRNPYLALQGYLGGLLALSQAASRRVVVASLLGREPDVCVPAPAALIGKIDSLVAGISIQPVRGDGQRLLDDGTLPMPLVASVRLIGTGVPSPVPAVPVRFTAAPGSEPSRTRSDQFGLATAEISGVPLQPTGEAGEGHAIEVALDAAAILADAGLETGDPRFDGLAQQLRARKAAFSYLLPGEAATRVAVLITELLGGEQAGTSVVGEQLAFALQEQGYELLDPRHASGAFTAPATVGQAVAALRGHADLVVFGTVRAEVIKALSQNFIFARAEGEVQLVETSSGDVIASVDHAVKGAGRDDIAALERALTSFARMLTLKVRQAIGSRTEPAP